MVRPLLPETAWPHATRVGSVVKRPGFTVRLGDADLQVFAGDPLALNPSLGLAICFLLVWHPNGFEQGPARSQVDGTSVGTGLAGGLAVEAEACNLGSVPPDRGDTRNQTAGDPGVPLCELRGVGCEASCGGWIGVGSLGAAAQSSVPLPTSAAQSARGGSFLVTSLLLVTSVMVEAAQGSLLSFLECRWGQLMGPRVCPYLCASGGKAREVFAELGPATPSVIQGPPVWSWEARLGGPEPTLGSR